MNRDTLWSVARASLATVFLLLPMVAWVESFDAANCDDKAVHWFSAMHAAAGSAEREAFREGIAPFVAASESHPRWRRTEFRLQAGGSYPLLNALIVGLHSPGVPWLAAVERSLLVTALLPVVLVAVVAGSTPLGLWPALLTLNVIAWQVLPADLLLGRLPLWMMPFLSHAPRNAGSLLAIPAVLALAARRPWLLGVILAAVFLWHVGLGLLLGLLVLGGAVVSWPLARRLDDFHDRALVASLAILAVGIGLSALTNRPEIDRMVQAVSGLDVPRQFHQRTLATQYCVGALAVVLAARRAGLFAMRGLLPAHRRQAGNQAVSRNLPVAAILTLLVAIALGRISSLREVAAGQSGFFVTTCGASTPVRLPEGWRDLTLDDEPQLFVSFGNYLLELRRPGSMAAPP